MDAAADIRAIRHELEEATDAMISAAMQGLALLDRAKQGDADAVTGLEGVLCAILQACAFQDSTGQRLDRLTALRNPGAGSDPLLNGPANPGEGLDQSMADAVFADRRTTSHA